jgi:hypothetical protein
VFGLPLCAGAKKAHPGPCRQGQIVSIVDRPGTGSATTVSGSPCTVEKGRAVLEYGYQNEIDVGRSGTSILSSYPQALLRFGIEKRDEFIVVPPTTSVRAGNAGEAYVPAIGTQDAGFGWKHSIHSHAWYQDAVEAFVTAPTGSNGYSIGIPTYSLGYVGAFSLGERFSLNSSLALVSTSGSLPNAGATRRFLSVQPSLTLAYAATPNLAFSLNDAVAIPSVPRGGSTDVLLFALQRALSPGTVLDVETDYNLTPLTGYRQRAIGFGGAFYL